jgi:hypothetical protein
MFVYNVEMKSLCATIIEKKVPLSQKHSQLKTMNHDLRNNLISECIGRSQNSWSQAPRHFVANIFKRCEMG